MNMKTERRVTRPPLRTSESSDRCLSEENRAETKSAKRKNICTAKSVHPNYITMKVQ